MFLGPCFTGIMTNYSSALTTNSSRYGGVFNYYYYESVPTNVSMTGDYTFISSNNVWNEGNLYENSFNPSNSTQNLVARYLRNGSYREFTIFASIHSGTNYFLVIRTVHPFPSGSFSIVAYGAAPVNFVHPN
jgi:hypothetical protein